MRHTQFICQDYAATIAAAEAGDIVYCDPPYAYSQSILYGAHSFDLESLWASLKEAVDRGASVALSLNGHRKNGARQLSTVIPDGIFSRELVIDRGGCMLRRFQSAGQTMDGEKVADRLPSAGSCVDQPASCIGRIYPVGTVPVPRVQQSSLRD